MIGCSNAIIIGAGSGGAAVDTFDGDGPGGFPGDARIIKDHVVLCSGKLFVMECYSPPIAYPVY